MDESYNLNGKRSAAKSTYLLFYLYKVQKQVKPILVLVFRIIVTPMTDFLHESGREGFQRAGINLVSSVYIKLSSSSLKIYAYSVCKLCFNTNFTHNIDDNGELTYDPSPEFLLATSVPVCGQRKN